MSKQFNKKPSNEPEKTIAADVPAEATPESDIPASNPPVTNELSTAINEKAQGLSEADLNEALKLLRGEVRRRATERESLRPKAGSKVRILKGRPKYVGKLGTAIIVRRSRCFVSVPDTSSPAYVLIADLELVER